MLAQHALCGWNGKVDRAVGMGFAEGGSFVQSLITGAFDAIRERLPAIPHDRHSQIEGRGMLRPGEGR